jgi:uncharacterized protein YecE (DUF72 family)
MKFGKLPLELLDTVDFDLPQDHADTLNILSPSKAKTTVYFGCTGWGNKDWIGHLYPKGTKAKDFLSNYGKQFRSVELNTTHYRIPTSEMVVRWAETVPDGFNFCPKIYQGISHWDRLKETRDSTVRFCDAISNFEGKLGPSFLQMHPTFKPDSDDALFAYLERWPSGFPLALELRDPLWYADRENADRLFEHLRAHNCIPIITDTAGHRDLVHMRLSTKNAMIRFVGNQLHPSDYTRIDQWVDRIGKWSQNGLESCWFFMHQHEELHSPMLIRYMSQQLLEKFDVNVQVPELVEQQATLF